MKPLWVSSLKCVVRDVSPKPPYAITPHLRRFSLPNHPTPAIVEGSTYRRLVNLGKGLVAVKAVVVREGWKPLIRFRVCSPKSLVEEGLRVAVSMFRTGFSYLEFLKAASKSPAIYGLALKYLGLRPIRTPSLYESLIESVVEQRVALKAALRTISSLVKDFSACLRVGGEPYYSEPLPVRVAGVSEDFIRGHGLTRVKARALREVALAEVEGRLPSVNEVTESPNAAVNELVKLYGVGRWTAEIAVAKVLPDFRVGPASDLAVRRGLSAIYGRELGEGEVREIASAYGEFTGLVMYLGSLER